MTVPTWPILWLAHRPDVGTIGGVAILSAADEPIVRLGIVRGQRAAGAGCGWSVTVLQVVDECRYASLDVALAESQEFEQALLAGGAWRSIADVDEGNRR